jgi:light-regulated signal transduction histidine kinase (bacteriophytochrome)
VGKFRQRVCAAGNSGDGVAPATISGMRVIANPIECRGEGTPRIRASSERKAQTWISARDNGIGIAPKYAGRMFGMFKRPHGKEFPGIGTPARSSTS